MKKVILTGCIAAFTFFVGNVNAQTYAEVEKPAAENPWSIEVLMDALNQDNTGIKFHSPAIRARYFFNDKIALRLQLGLGDGAGSAMSEHHEVNENSDGTGGTGTLDIKRMGVAVQLGVEYHFIGTQKLDPYAALGINFGGGNQKTTASELNPAALPALAYNDQYKMEGEGGYSVFGAKLGLGADFYFVENVYIGLELGLGFGSINHSEQKRNTTYTPTSGSATTTKTIVSGSKEAYLGTQALFRLGWRF